jgi:hypothetical protein
LADDGLKCADPDFFMVWNRNRYRTLEQPLLHYNVAAPPTYFCEAMSCQMEHTCLPERTRSLPKGHLDLGYENLAVKTLLNFFR